MTITRRAFHAEDIQRIGAFLVQHYQPDNQGGNWLRPAWDYMHSHSMLDKAALGRIGIWEEGGEIVGVAHYESRLGEVFFQCHPAYADLKQEMLSYAARHLAPPDHADRMLRVYVNDFDHEFEKLVKEAGYHLYKKSIRPLAQLKVPDQIPAPDVPDGFQVLSLAEENDLTKINQVLWRGFNHPGDPPREEEEGRKKMQSSPNFRQDLTIVVADQSGMFRTFCGFWYVPENKYGVIEPLATDPDFRRMGLAREAVWEGVRRCRNLGADTIYVGSDQPFYLSLGFKVLYLTQAWIKDS
jgi:predicted N-acetyltransferase YhbS